RHLRHSSGASARAETSPPPSTVRRAPVSVSPVPSSVRRHRLPAPPDTAATAQSTPAPCSGSVACGSRPCRGRRRRAPENSASRYQVRSVLLAWWCPPSWCVTCPSPVIVTLTSPGGVHTIRAPRAAQNAAFHVQQKPPPGSDAVARLVRRLTGPCARRFSRSRSADPGIVSGAPYSRLLT